MTSIISFIRDYLKNSYLKKLIKRGLKLGDNVYLNDGFFLDPSHCHLITIENNVVFGPNVSIFAHDASTKKVINKTRIAPVCLHENCFIGAGSIILPGSKVGRNSILAALSKLSGEIPDNQVWGGNPAKFIMTIDEYKDKLQKQPAESFCD